MELIVLGASGSYPAPGGGACSGYLVRVGTTTLWMDCGNGTLANLQEHVTLDELTGVVVTHEHPDHCVDLYGLHVALTYGLHREGLPVFAPEGLAAKLETLVGTWGPCFDWHDVGGDGAAEVARLGDLGLRFSRTDHGPPTMAVEASHDGRRVVYTADTGPGWSVDAFGAGADLVLSEATLQRDREGEMQHLSARQAGAAAREARAARLVITHLWPTLDPQRSIEEGGDAFGRAVTSAVPHARFEV